MLYRLSRFTSVFALLAVSMTAYAQRPSELHNNRPASPREVIVRFRSTDLTSLMDSQREGDIDQALTVGHGNQNRFLFHSRSKNIDALIQALSKRADVVDVQPNFIYTAKTVPNDAYYGDLWGMPKIGAPAAWDVTTGGSNAVIAAVDSGIEYTHSDLVGNIWTAPAAFTVSVGGSVITCPAGSHGFDAIANSCNPADANGHGTHVSGTIGASGNNGGGVAGVNWSAKIIGARMLDASGSGSTAQAINAIEFLIQAKSVFASTATPLNIRVLSASWGGPGVDQALADEISRAAGYDMLFVAAAGNDGVNTDTSPYYPANAPLPNIIAVASTNSSDALSSFSNRGGSTVHLAAPGEGIVSTYLNNGYANGSGTSMATPHVSGAALLILAACPALSTAQLKNAILNNVDPVPALAGQVTTGGRLNVDKAIRSCRPASDYSVSVSPGTQTVVAGQTATYTVTLTPANGFTGTVNLSATGAPAGAVVSFNPAQATVGGSPVSSTLTITASSGSAGTYALNITGASGSLSHSTTATLVVNAPSTPPSPLPSAPANLTARANFGGSISLSWTAGGTNQDSFSIERCTGSGCTNFAPIASAAGTATSFNDTAVATSAYYTYRVRAVNSAGSSPYSNVAGVRAKNR